MVLYSPLEKKIENDTFLLKEVWKDNTFSLNFGASFENFGGTIGYSPDVLMKNFEAHLGIFNSWQDTFNLEFKPKIGIGVTIKF